MGDVHSEWEYKFAADHVELKEFLAWAMLQRPVRYIYDESPDLYYGQGDNVVRHRWNGGAGELTVKHRKSKSSTFDREEIDLHFDKESTVNDVTQFLKATGWKKLFVLHKDFHVFWYKLAKGGEVCLCIYTVDKFNEKTRRHDNQKVFVEIEMEKGSHYNLASSKQILNEWKHLLTEEFDLDEPVELSLYEIYSKKLYGMVRRKR